MEREKQFFNGKYKIKKIENVNCIGIDRNSKFTENGSEDNNQIKQNQRHLHIEHKHDQMHFKYGQNPSNLTRSSKRFISKENMRDSHKQLMKYPGKDAYLNHSNERNYGTKEHKSERKENISLSKLNSHKSKNEQSSKRINSKILTKLKRDSNMQVEPSQNVINPIHPSNKINELNARDSFLNLRNFQNSTHLAYSNKTTTVNTNVKIHLFFLSFTRETKTFPYAKLIQKKSLIL
jgi:hypothetical protein